VWGGGQRSVFSSTAVPLVATSTLGTGLYSNVTGSGGVGTNSNPATGGTGMNLFANPQAAWSNFGYVQLSQNLDGYGHPMTGLPFWNLDSSLGKRIAVGEHRAIDLSFDFYNMFNHPNFANPGMSLTGTTTGFGVISSTAVPANRQSSSRWIMTGLRFEF
jgi:hypothetical protein